MRFVCLYHRYSILNIGAAGIDIYANVGSSYLHASRKEAMLSRVQKYKYYIAVGHSMYALGHQ